MKLSEAIIKGCEGTYQIHGETFNGRGGYCVIGAAKRGLGLPDGETFSDALMLTHPDIEQAILCLRQKFIHPVNGRKTEVGTACINLNDYYKWPRLSIAEWLANVVEPQFEKEAK